MNTSSTKTLLALALATTTAALFSAPAAAATKLSSIYQNAGGNCHAASPIDEFSMVRTPFAYRNTGAGGWDDDDLTHHELSSAHNNSKATISTSSTSSSGGDVLVICNMATDLFSIGKPTQAFSVVAVQLFARNTLTNQNAQLKCTLWGGYETGTGSISIVAPTKTLSSSGIQGAVTWLGTASQNLPGPPNLACIVPVGVELNDAIIIFEKDVGA